MTSFAGLQHFAPISSSSAVCSTAANQVGTNPLLHARSRRFLMKRRCTPLQPTKRNRTPRGPNDLPMLADVEFREWTVIIVTLSLGAAVVLLAFIPIYRTRGNRATSSSWKASPRCAQRLVSGSGTTGLVNLGQSCYLNSVVQILAHIPAFVDLFLQEVR